MSYLGHRLLIVLIALSLLSMIIPRVVRGVEPEEVIVVVNKRLTGSEELARHYMEKRRIPENALVQVALTLSETISREEYDADLKRVVGNAIEARKPKRTEAVVLLHGVPLKVDPPQMTWEERDELRRLKQAEENRTATGEGLTHVLSDIKADLRKKMDGLLKLDQRASVDSELALVKRASYPLSGWLANPYFLGLQDKKQFLSKDDVILVCRLDGPDIATVRRIIDDTLETERRGLQGNAYFDARWSRPAESNGLGGYQLYDLSLYRAADATRQRIPTVVDGREDLFPTGSCPEAALYSGWYSLGRYIDAFSWSKGAIAYHIASSECATLRDRNFQGWCVNLIERGVVATVGPVHEPYVQGFPLPELFFGLLTQGNLSLGEVYQLSLPYLSWQMVLVGDPLYRPFSPAP